MTSPMLTEEATNAAWSAYLDLTDGGVEVPPGSAQPHPIDLALMAFLDAQDADALAEALGSTIAGALESNEVSIGPVVKRYVGERVVLALLGRAS